MNSLFDDHSRSYRSILSACKLMNDVELKSLRDMCLECIGNNLHCITRSSQYIAPVHKELILERLAFHNKFTEEYLPHVTYNLFSHLLRRINLYNCCQVDNAWLKQLAASNCKLSYLTIDRCENVQDAGVRYITQGQDELRELELRNLSIKKKSIINIRSPHLQKLDLKGCSQMCNVGVQDVVQNSANIRHLVLSRCGKLTDTVFSVIAKCLNVHLEYLDLDGVHVVSDVSILPLAEHCPNLRRLNVHSCRKLTMASLIPLFRACRSLEKLDLSFCVKLADSTPTSAHLLNNLPNAIQELSLSGLQIEDSGLLTACVGRLERVTKLNLCGVPALNDDMLEQIMQSAGSRLTHFDICGSVTCNITDKGIASISAYCTRLEMLGISLLKEVSGVTLLPLFDDHKRALLITHLMMSLRNLDVCVLHAIAFNCHNLEHLSIPRTPVDNTILDSLARVCRHLQYVNLKACKNVQDSGVMSLARHCPLRVLILSGVNNITDRSIRTLAQHCPYLEELYVSGCEKVSDASLYYLMDVCIPRLYAAHRVPNIVPLL